MAPRKATPAKKATPVVVALEAPSKQATSAASKKKARSSATERPWQRCRDNAAVVAEQLRPEMKKSLEVFEAISNVRLPPPVAAVRYELHVLCTEFLERRNLDRRVTSNKLAATTLLDGIKVFLSVNIAIPVRARELLSEISANLAPFEMTERDRQHAKAAIKRRKVPSSSSKRSRRSATTSASPAASSSASVVRRRAVSEPRPARVPSRSRTPSVGFSGDDRSDVDADDEEAVDEDEEDADDEVEQEEAEAEAEDDDDTAAYGPWHPASDVDDLSDDDDDISQDQRLPQLRLDAHATDSDTAGSQSSGDDDDDISDDDTFPSVASYEDIALFFDDQPALGNFGNPEASMPETYFYSGTTGGPTPALSRAASGASVAAPVAAPAVHPEPFTAMFHNNAAALHLQMSDPSLFSPTGFDDYAVYGVNY